MSLGHFVIPAGWCIPPEKMEMKEFGKLFVAGLSMNYSFSTFLWNPLSHGCLALVVLVSLCYKAVEPATCLESWMGTTTLKTHARKNQFADLQFFVLFCFVSRSSFLVALPPKDGRYWTGCDCLSFLTVSTLSLVFPQIYTRMLCVLLID